MLFLCCHRSTAFKASIIIRSARTNFVNTSLNSSMSVGVQQILMQLSLCVLHYNNCLWKFTEVEVIN